MMRIHRLVPLVALALAGCNGSVEGYPENPELARQLAESDALAVKGGQVKVTICHVPPGNPSNAHEITVGAPAVPAHLAHGDTIGACGDCQVDQSACETCGNGQLDDGEDCDGTNLGGATCQAFGFDGGTIVCTASCTIDRSGCTNEPPPPPPPPPGECSSCGDCDGQACVDGQCGACRTSADCCQPLQCFAGTCSLF